MDETFAADIVEMEDVPGVQIPEDVLERLALSEGDQVEVTITKIEPLLDDEDEEVM